MEKYFGKLPCKLTTRAIVGLEAATGKSALNFLAGDEIPSVKDLLTIVYHAAHAVNKSITVEAIMDEFDDIDIGYKGLIEFVADLYKASGLIPQETPEGN